MTEQPRPRREISTPPWADAPSFIERQFPVAKVSAESFKERRAVQSQTLTGTGKWWGRKPLILVRATILGLLLPATDNPQRDRAILLKLLTMDAEGLRRRRSKPIPTARLAQELAKSPQEVAVRFLDPSGPLKKPVLKHGLSRAEKAEAQEIVFERLPYSEKLGYCERPEQIAGPSPEAWAEINAHLDTAAASLPELIEELGKRRFGHRPHVGDAFSGGGSIPFEAARIGCNVYGSDLNPVAALLTWAALNIVGGDAKLAGQVRHAQEVVFAAVDKQIIEWGIEHNEQGWRADAYLYCTEVADPESGWRVPLASSWVIGEGSPTIAQLVPDNSKRHYEISIIEDVGPAELEAARGAGTAKENRMFRPGAEESTPINALRRNMRLWENDDVIPRPDDVFQERLYCIRWVETYTDEKGRTQTRRHYRAPTSADLKREARVLEILRERFSDWQQKGYIPSRRIEPGYNTNQPIRERGWTHWHHLFTPRQLLLHGLLLQQGFELFSQTAERVAVLLGVGRCCNWNSRLCGWGVGQARESFAQTFYNQALNTLLNYGSKGLTLLSGTWPITAGQTHIETEAIAEPADARAIGVNCDYWITDPPYADAINYEEVSEFFLAWYDGALQSIFPNWYSDSKRALAVKGSDEDFRRAMVVCYQRLTDSMPAHGVQVVMFTHQDAAVWADLALILWAAGLHVTAAWCIATETDAAVREGNYVQGTVLLILRKRVQSEPVFLDEITHRVESEVRRQLDTMLSLDDESDPNFGDADYQLAAYAAALRVLTERPIEEIDPAREIARPRVRGEEGPVERLIRNAVKIACDHLVPRGFDGEVWKDLGPFERFYLKGLEVESHGEYRNGVYQELARGFGAPDYDDLLANTRANETRLKTASEFAGRMLSGGGFAETLVRQILFAVHKTAADEATGNGLAWLRTELREYWPRRERTVQILEWLGTLAHAAPMAHWQADAAAALLLAGAVRNDHV